MYGPMVFHTVDGKYKDTIAELLVGRSGSELDADVELFQERKIVT